MKVMSVTLAVVVAFMSLFIFGLLRDPNQRDDIPSNFIGQPAPSFNLPVFARYQAEFGTEFNSLSGRGKPMVVNFWAWDCLPCREEMPALEASWQKYQGQLLFIGIHTKRDQIQQAEAFLDTYLVTYPNVIDSEFRANIDYGLFGVPETFFIDADGTTNYRHSGPLTREVLNEQIQALLVDTSTASR